jgi:hypothetical protein
MLDSTALADLIAELVGDHVERATAPLIARIGELEARETVAGVAERLAEIERDLPALAERVAAPLIDDRIKAIPTPRNGHDVSDIVMKQDGNTVELRFTVGDTDTVFEIELPVAEKGEPGRDGLDGKDGRDGKDGAPGKVEMIKAWEDRVHYAGEIVAFNGATYQAQRDTGRLPETDDWACIAARGADGRDGRQIVIRGTHDAAYTYSELDVVAMNGASFVAKRDDPGPCPGDGWQLMAAQGKRGAPGERGVMGEKGERGQPGPGVVDASVNDEGVLQIRHADGSTVAADFYPLFDRMRGR